MIRELFHWFDLTDAEIEGLDADLVAALDRLEPEALLESTRRDLQENPAYTDIFKRWTPAELSIALDHHWLSTCLASVVEGIVEGKIARAHTLEEWARLVARRFLDSFRRD